MKKTLSRTLVLLLIAAGLFASLCLAVGIYVISQIPSEKEIKGCLVTKMYEVNLCPQSGNYVKYSQISPFLVKAVVLTEDSGFWQHNGFDYQEMQKSLETNLKKGTYARGGSTITQQLAKNLFLTKQKTLVRKGLEALITLRLEKYLTKKEILEKYFNVVQFGKDLFGVKKAAQFYFKKSPAELDAVESAFLAMLLPSPENYSKSFFKKQLTPFARQRISQILDRMYQYDRITSEEYEAGRSRIDYFLGGTPPVEMTPEIEAIDEQAIEQELDEAGSF